MQERPEWVSMSDEQTAVHTLELILASKSFEDNILLRTQIRARLIEASRYRLDEYLLNLGKLIINKYINI